MILLDTDTCIFLLRGRRDVVQAFEAHAAEEPAISILTVGELYFGARRSQQASRNLVQCESFVDRVAILGLDREIMSRFAELKADLWAKGERLEDPDLLIAATALTRDVLLVTHNLAHFSRIRNLRLADWCT